MTKVEWSGWKWSPARLAGAIVLRASEFVILWSFVIGYFVIHLVGLGVDPAQSY